VYVQISWVTAESSVEMSTVRAKRSRVFDLHYYNTTEVDADVSADMGAETVAMENAERLSQR
jgi:hypothetical protein